MYNSKVIIMKKLRIIAISVIILSCGIAAKAQNYNPVALDQYFQTLCDNNKFMGNVSIFHNGAEIYSKSVGFADIDQQIPNSKSAKKCIGSISKTFTAVMTFKAIEAGKLSLSETLHKYFPSIVNADKITIGHLLSHRSGIHNYTANWEFMQWSTKTREQMIEIITARGSDFEPDTHADYSNSNYVLLSYILEDIYGKSYADILTVQITKPLSLNNTYFGKNTIDVSDNESNSYLFSDKWQIQTVTEPSVTLGAGCIISNPNDLNNFIVALFNGKLISKESLSDMLNIRDDYGMGIFPVPYFSKSGYGHRGGVDGFNSMFIYFPEDKISYAITSNALNYNFTEIHIAVLNCIYRQPSDIPNFSKITTNSEVLDKYTGVYTSSQLPLEVTVTKENNSLLVQATGQPAFLLEPSSEHLFRFVENDVVIEFNPANETMILIQGEGVLYFGRQ
jgi:Beta-lactamase class C and other penicillin binding proteins